jgi:hypothetical protein
MLWPYFRRDQPYFYTFYAGDYAILVWFLVSLRVMHLPREWIQSLHFGLESGVKH